MAEQPSNDNPLTPQQTESDVLVLIRKMQQQLVFLEKKIDLLISRPQEKPFRSFDRPQHRPGHFNERGPERGPGESFKPQREGFRPRAESFKPRGEGFKHQGEGFKHQGEGFKHQGGEGRENNFSQDRPFKKKFDGKKRGFDPRKKTFFHKRKDQ